MSLYAVEEIRMSMPGRCAGDANLAVLFRFGATGALSDLELLARFTAQNDREVSEAAFAALVARHGRMVQGVCRRILGDDHDTDDAFQATFLILARKAASVRVEDSLGRWLHGVSVRVARRARAIAIAHRRRAQPLDRIDPPDVQSASDAMERKDFQSVIDEEISRLPARYRSVIVLCCMEGASDDMAAYRLRCAVGTIHSRLHRARERLRIRLKSRGLTLGVGALAALADGSSPRASISRGLTSSTAKAAMRLVAGKSTAGIVPATALALADSAHKSVFLMRAAVMAASALAVFGLAAPGPGARARTESSSNAENRHIAQGQWRFIEPKAQAENRDSRRTLSCTCEGIRCEEYCVHE